jgi:hypothetical protein
MSSTVTARPTKGVRGIGTFNIIAGLLLIAAGVLTWTMVTMQLADEQITVAEDSELLGGMFAGRRVIDPFTAYAQADIINQHALEASGGQTYAQLPQDSEMRPTMMNASFLRASLFTSVVAFGIAALVIGLGILFILIGSALRRLAGGTELAASPHDYTSDGTLSAPGRRTEQAPQTTQPTEPGPGGPPR